MNTTLFALRNVKYKRLQHLLGRSLTISSFDQIECEALGAVARDVPEGFRPTNSFKTFEGMLAKYGFLDLDFSMPRDLLTSGERINGRSIHELGYSRPRGEARRQNEGDRACLEILMESARESTTYLRLFLDSAWSRDAMKRIHDAVKRQLSGKNVSMEAYDEAFRSAMFETIDTLKKSFPITFTIEDACLTNSDAIWLEKHFYL
jgi:hypothetical protein